MTRLVFPDVWRLTVTVDQADVEAVAEVLERHGEAVTMFMDDLSGRSDGEGLWHVEGICRVPPERAAIVADLAAWGLAAGVGVPDLEIERIANVDWVLENLRDFPPIHAGRFFVHGSHWRDGVPRGRIGLQVDAGTAFGSGEHATTQGCLLALDRLVKSKRQVRRVLDVGSGSGILAIAMAHLWPVPVLATDIDPVAVIVAQKNAALNGVGSQVRAAVSDGWRNPVLRKHAPYDVVTANILARPLCRFAPKLAAALAPGGVAVLSGLLDWQQRMVMAAHERQGLRLKDRLVINGWATLIIGR